ARHDLALETHASAEAQVAAVSDDVAYNNHDLADGLRAGVITVTQVCQLPIVGRCFAEVDRVYPVLDPSRRQHEALRRLFGIMVDDVLDTSRTALADSGVRSAWDVREFGQPVVFFSDEMQGEIDQIRAFLYENMYHHWRVRRMRVKAAQVVRDLFAAFMDDPHLLPPEWRSLTEGQTDSLRARVIADYIAGMTDRFAMQEHTEIHDPTTRALGPFNP
ncbi:MAG: deoxyguanosinetriphosphate triphosphohydrolase, partial [Pseudomonadota bacterium]